MDGSIDFMRRGKSHTIVVWGVPKYVDVQDALRCVQHFGALENHAVMDAGAAHPHTYGLSATFLRKRAASSARAAWGSGACV